MKPRFLRWSLRQMLGVTVIAAAVCYAHIETLPGPTKQFSEHDALIAIGVALIGARMIWRGATPEHRGKFAEWKFGATGLSLQIVLAVILINQISGWGFNRGEGFTELVAYQFALLLPIGWLSSRLAILIEAELYYLDRFETLVLQEKQKAAGGPRSASGHQEMRAGDSDG